MIAASVPFRRHTVGNPAVMETTMSYRVEVTTDDTGRWYRNELHFETAQEADSYGADLWHRWTLVRDFRVVESAGIVDARFAGGLVELVA